METVTYFLHMYNAYTISSQFIINILLFNSLHINLRAEAVLGVGEFGEVFKGTWDTPYGPQEVALKMLKKGSTDKQKATFLQEAAIMAQFRHPHIVRLLGAVTLIEPVSDDTAVAYRSPYK